MGARSFTPVILCGGAGARLWPASTPERPKAFLALIGEDSLLQQTARRVASIPGALPPIVVGAARHVGLIREQLAAIGVTPRLIAEPGGRGSASAIAAAALEIAAEDRRGLALVVASDHHVPDTVAFAAGVTAALEAAADGAVVTFGVTPTRPSAGYGYIRPGRTLHGEVRASAEFIEKPELARSAALIEAGWLWNSGNFVFRADVMLEELAAREPHLLAAVVRARDNGVREEGVLTLGEAFLDAPELAIDVAVMERTKRGAVLAVDYAWSDLGTWESVLAAAGRDGAGNAVDGAAVVVDSEDCLIRGGEGARIIAIGLKDIAVIVEGGRVLVCDLTAAPSIKAAVKAIEDL